MAGEVPGPRQSEVQASAATIPYDKRIVRVSEAGELVETKYYNRSGQPFEVVMNKLPHDLYAEKVVIMPDFNPTRAPLPTGVSVEINPQAQPDWRRFAVSDVGCGMQLLESGVAWEDFERDIHKWDALYTRLQQREKGALGDLGGGNHFLDAAVDVDLQDSVYFLIHTGSRDESPKAAQLVDQPEEFDRTYVGITRWARNNRNTIRREIEAVYGPTRRILDKTHNFYVERPDGHVVIYKGSVRLRPGILSVIPSSMAGDMVVVSGRSERLEELNFAMAHGTGRVLRRGDTKEAGNEYDFDAMRNGIYVPGEIANTNIKTEAPNSYRDLDTCLALIDDLITVEQRLSPIAYMGHIDLTGSPIVENTDQL